MATLTGLHATDYESTLKNLIASKEGYKTKIYTDGVGVPTIGAGYALTKQKNWTTDFATAKINLTETQQTALQNLIDAAQRILATTLTTAQREAQVKALVTTYNASSNAITLNVTQIGDLFETIKSTYENIVKSNLGTTLYNSLANTKELVALVDLAYNGGEGIFGSGLVNALKNNDRAEAWFQIRYQSNGGSSYQTVGTGIAERRVAESNLFDLYPTDADENYYKQVMQMYTVHKDTIYAVEHNTFKPSGNDEPIKRAYEKDGLIDTQLSPAKDYLVSNYAQGITIDGDIIVGQGIGNEGEAYADKTVGSDTNLKYTNKNDLIFGERGDDTLTGGAGSDVLYGGEGFDTYVTGAGDIVNDSDHEGKVYLAGHLLQGGNAISGQTNQYKGNYGETYTLNADHSLSVTLGSETITIQNYDQQKQSLGITLGKTIEVTVGDSEVYEDAKMMRVYVSINTTLEKDLTLSIMSLQQSATETEDYQGFGENGKPYGEVVIKAGETTGYIDIPIISDDIKEDTETFNITAMPDLTLDTSTYPLGVKYDGTDLSNISFLNAGVGTIKDGGTKDVVITIDNASVDEDTGMMTFTIRSNTSLDKDLVIDLMSIDGSAKEGEDYTGVSDGQVIIKAGTTGTTFSVKINADQEEEPNETFTLAPKGYTYTGDDLTTLLFDNAGVGTIVNDDKGLKNIEISISDAIANEKEGTITFNITLNQELDKELSFGVMSLDGSAKAGEDYTEAMGLVTIAAKSKTGTFTVALKDDNITESPETFILSPDGGFGYNGNDLGSLLFIKAGEGTIVDGKDIEITISDTTANEKEGVITFTANINQPLDHDFTFNVSTIDGSATGNVDYMSVPNGTMTIKAGETEATYSIAIASDGIYENSEEFMLYAHYEQGTYTGYDLGKVTGGTGVGTIIDDPINGSCPKPVTPNFGFNFNVPTPVVSASGGSYYYSGGGSGGSYYTPSVYSSTPTTYTPPPVTLPNVPVYECHYDVTLFSVAVVSLPVACLPSTPPLVFDLNHDGVTSLSMAASLALFDYNADNVKEHTAWIQNGDALLVRDTNNDGLITNGAELFGDHTLKTDGTTASDGYDALRDYDTNNDGIIDAKDEHFNDLKLWRDNGDGITEQGELKTLTEENITSITLPNTTQTPVTEEGNTITNASTYTQSDGTTGDVKDVWFTYENIATETYFDTDGDGFSEKMDSWMDANQGVLVWDKNKDGKINSGKEIVGTNMLLPNGKTANDSFSALNAFDTNHDGIIDANDTAGLAIWKDTNKNGQTDEGELLQIAEENSLTSINLNPFQNMLSGYDRNHDMKLNSSDAIYNYMYEQENADGTISFYLPNNADAKAMLGNYTGGESIQTSQGVKTLKEVIFYDGELPLNDTLQGTAQNDKLIGNRRDNVLYGNDGRDIIDTKEGNDTLEGGKGDDYLLGGAGDDTYVFGKGDGIDLIEDSSGNDTLKFKEGISKEDLILKQNGNDLIIGIKDGTKKFNELSDKVVLSNWFEADKKIETLLDANGTVINIETIEKENASTLISVSETFENGAMGWSNNTTTIASELTQFLGRFGGTGGQEGISKSYDFGIENAGKKVTIEFDMYKIDSWDGEEFDIFINSQKILNVLPVSDAYTSQNIFTDWGPEKMSHYSLQATIGEDGKLQLGFGSTLNQSISDESWGVDNIAIHAENESSHTLQLNGGTDQLSTTQIVTSAKTGDQVTVSFEMNWNGQGGVMPVAFYCYDLYLYHGMLGFNTGNADMYGIADASFLIGSTHTITAVFTQGNVHFNKLYIDGVEQTLTQLLGTPSNSMADITKELNLGQWDINGGYGFQGTIDNVQLHNRALTQDEVNSITGKEIVNDGLVASYDFEGAVPYVDKSGNGHTASASGNLTVTSDIEETNNIDRDDYKNIVIDNEILVDNKKTLAEAELNEIILKTGYTGVGTSGTTAKTTTEGVDFAGTLENKWFQTDTLDTKYVYEGEVSEKVQSLANIQGQGTVRDIQHVMSENQTLADTVSSYKAQSSSSSFSDLDSQMDAILAQWVGSDTYGSASQTTPPIVLDLNSNGITSTSLEGSEAYFDYDGNGRRELSAWVEKDDALLAVDLNNDGVINNASELFGTYTKLSDGTLASDGYNALNEYDTNNDGIVDAHDEKFSNLRLWQDANQNGKTDAGELKSLVELGVTSLSLTTTTINRDENGNTLSEESSFSTADGTNGTMRDVWFSYSDKHTIAVSELSDADEKKLAIVEAFLGTTLSASERANPYIVAEAFEKYDTLKYDTMAKMFSNALFGKDFPSCQFMFEALNNTLARIVSGKSNETEIALAANLVAAVLKRNTANALEEIDHMYLQNTFMTQLLQERDIEINFVDNKLVGHVGNHYYGTANGGSLDLSSHDEGVIVEAKGGNDVILGSQGRDRLYGGSGNDIIRGNGGVDILSGRQGNDLLIGGNEQSVYEYYLGDGNDIILDQGGKNDILRFAYLSPSDIKIERSGDDMIIKVKSPDGSFEDAFGSITVKNGYTTGKIEQFYFNGQILTFEDLTLLTPSDTAYSYNKGDSKLTIYDTGGNDKIVFGEGITFDNIVTKQDGEDLIIALKFEDRPFDELQDQLTIKGFFNETNRIESFIFSNGVILTNETILSVLSDVEHSGLIVGDAGDNTLIGTQGNDIFNAKAGNDSISGLAGDDTYIFNRGDGKDVIIESAGNDTLMLGLDIRREDILAKVVGDDIILGVKETGKSFEELSDTITIKNWTQTGFEIEKVMLDDGTVLSLDDLLNQAPVLIDTDVSVVLQDFRESTGAINVTDPDGDTLTYSITTQAEHGTLSVDETGAWVYVANEGYIGEDSAIVKVDDGNGGVVEQTLNFILAVSAPSIAITDLILDEDTSFESILHVTNPIGGTLTYEILNATTHGTFTLNNDGSYSYNPLANYNGEDSVTIKVTNEYGLSSIKVIDLAVSSVNDTPVLASDSMNITLQDIRNINGQVEASDIENDTLTYSISTQASHGVVSIDENGAWVYKANAGYIGNDSAVILVDDSNGGTVEQTLNFDVKVSTPIIETLTLALLEDTSLTELLAVNNPIGGALTYEILDTSDYGSFSVDAEGHVSYTPILNYNGEDSVTIKVTNAYGLSTIQTIRLDIASVNDAPTLSSDESNYTLNNIRVISDHILASDVDNDTLTYSVASKATHGVVSVDENGVWVYKADGSYNGEDSAVIRVDDGNGGTIEQTLHFNIQGYIYEGEDLVIDDTSHDTLDMTSISKGDLSFTRKETDLLISIANSHTITLKNYFNTINAGVNTLVLSDGEINLTRDVINESRYGGYIALDSQDHLMSGDQYINWLIGNTGNDILFGANGNDYISGSSGNDLMVGGEGDDNLQGNNGDDIIYGDDGNDQIYAGDGNDAIIGGKGNDILFGENGNDWISGGLGNDTIYAGNGSDTIKGGSGDDFINGAYGSDTYLFNIGDGNDTIVDTSAYGSSDTDKIIFGEGITTENLQVLRDNYDLVLKVNDSDSVRVKYWFTGTQNSIEQIAFSDGTTLGTSDINALAMTQGTAGNDWLFGIDSLGDNIYGMAGNDSLYSYGGADFLSGGVGNDFLEGGSGSDTYSFNKGDGADTINEWTSWNSSDVDEIKFGDGITAEDISFILKGTDLLIQYSGNDTIKVANTYNASSPIERVVLSDGSYMSSDDMENIIQQMSAYACEKGIALSSNDVVRNNQDLMQIVSSGWHNA